MRYYPAYLDLMNRTVLVVGGGTVAESKIIQLIDARACVRVVSPTLTSRLESIKQAGILDHRAGRFEAADLDGVVLVISATNDEAVNREIADLAGHRGVLHNVVDQPALCDFITPAVVSRGELQISISTGGGSPSLAQRVKREVATLIGPEYGELLLLAAEMRQRARDQVPDFDERRALLHAFVESEALELIKAGRRDEAAGIANMLLNQAATEEKESHDCPTAYGV
jgi:precorrin-2 dehydrogenase/sirohydrochlorin ferrochelatase